MAELNKNYLNDFEALAIEYRQTHRKPDKRYSILPTLLNLAGPTKHKTILDLGCGDGFFAQEFAKDPTATVIGIDNSPAQINLANRNRHKNLSFVLGDAFKNPLPKADIMTAPFLLNYLETVDELSSAIQNFSSSLANNGILIAVVDLPDGANLQKYGARKILFDHTDGSPLAIELFNQGALICTLHSYYFRPETIEIVLRNNGFREIRWHQPLISQEGLELFGKDFWRGYRQNCELGYITAIK